MTDSDIIEKVWNEGKCPGGIVWKMPIHKNTDEYYVFEDKEIKEFAKQAIEAKLTEIRQKIEALEEYMFEDDWENDDFEAESCSMIKRAEVLAILGEEKK